MTDSRIYIADGAMLDLAKRKFDAYIRIDRGIEPPVEGEMNMPGNGVYLSPDEFEQYLATRKPLGVRISFDTQQELDYLIQQLRPYVTSLYLHAKHNRAFDLTPLQTCSQLESVQFYWNNKQETLWDIRKNTKLKHFELIDYNKVSDFSVFRGSSIETLRLFGCNACSSFVSKLHIDDPTFLIDMPKLKYLYLDIVKDESSEYYLKLLEKCKNLQTLSFPAKFFTFQQFAWLKAHLPNVTTGLECIYYSGDFVTIIGRRMPGLLYDKNRAEKYQKRYDALVIKYRNRETPPRDDEKD